MVCCMVKPAAKDVHLLLPDDLYSGLAEQAAAEKQPLSVLMQRVLEAWLARRSADQDELRRQVRIGLDQVEQGQGIPLDEQSIDSFFEEIEREVAAERRGP